MHAAWPLLTAACLRAGCPLLPGPPAPAPAEAGPARRGIKRGAELGRRPTTTPASQAPIHPGHSTIVSGENGLKGMHRRWRTHAVTRTDSVHATGRLASTCESAVRRKWLMAAAYPSMHDGDHSLAPPAEGARCCTQVEKVVGEGNCLVRQTICGAWVCVARPAVREGCWHSACSSSSSSSKPPACGRDPQGAVGQDVSPTHVAPTQHTCTTASRPLAAMLARLAIGWSAALPPGPEACPPAARPPCPAAQRAQLQRQCLPAALLPRETAREGGTGRAQDQCESFRRGSRCPGRTAGR